MNSVTLKDVFARAENWPSTDQDRLLEAALQIEQFQSSGITVTDDDLKVLSLRKKASLAGDFASDRSVKEVFNQFRTNR